MTFTDVFTGLSKLVAERGAKIEAGVPYGPLARHRLDVYRPEPHLAARAQLPICVFFYGGHWQSGERALYAFVGAALAANGVTTVIPDYRLYPAVRYPSFVDDGALALAHVATRIAAPNQSIVVAGHSAGAHIAGLVALAEPFVSRLPRRPAGLIAISGPMSFQPTTWPTTADIFKTAAHPDAPRPVAHVSAKSPSALGLHGANDTLVKPWNQREFKDAYARAGRPMRAVELPGLGHIDPLLAIARPLRWRGPVLDEMLAFLRSLA